MGSSCFFNFFIFCYNLHHFCVKISIPEVQTLRLTPILPQLICQNVFCHLSFMSIYDIWQLPNRICDADNMGVKWSVWTSGIQILSPKWLFQKWRNKRQVVFLEHTNMHQRKNPHNIELKLIERKIQKSNFEHDNIIMLFFVHNWTSYKNS